MNRTIRPMRDAIQKIRDAIDNAELVAIKERLAGNSSDHLDRSLTALKIATEIIQKEVSP